MNTRQIFELIFMSLYLCFSLLLYIYVMIQILGFSKEISAIISVTLVYFQALFYERISLTSNNKKMSNKISINGKIYSGKNVVISNNTIVIDGKKVESNDKVINVSIEGDINTLHVESCEQIKVNGNVAKIESGNGNVAKIESGNGNVVVNGDVTNVSNVNGSIKCKNINGNASTVNGDITKSFF